MAREHLLVVAWGVGAGGIEKSSGGTERLFPVKYLFGEAKIAYNFLLLEEG